MNAAERSQASFHRRATTATPRASVVMTVYRDMRFLDEAVSSVLNQRLADIELIVVDDGNADADAFGRLLRRDPRIRLVTCPTNLGTAAAANRGIAVARSEIVVRLDADDLCEPNRVGRLVAALERDPRLGLVGSDVRLLDEGGAPGRVVRMPRSDLEVRWTILFHNPFYHSATAFRRRLWEAAGGYRSEELVSQDHYLWFDLLPLCRARNLPEPLALYRLNSQGLMARNRAGARDRTHAIRRALWADLGLAYDLYDDGLARDVSRFLRGRTIAPERRRPAYELLNRVLAAFLAGPQARRNAQAVAKGERLREAIEARMAAAPAGTQA